MLHRRHDVNRGGRGLVSLQMASGRPFKHNRFRFWDGIDRTAEGRNSPFRNIFLELLASQWVYTVVNPDVHFRNSKAV